MKARQCPRSSEFLILTFPARRQSKRFKFKRLKLEKKKKKSEGIFFKRGKVDLGSWKVIDRAEFVGQGWRISCLAKVKRKAGHGPISWPAGKAPWRRIDLPPPECAHGIVKAEESWRWLCASPPALLLGSLASILHSETYLPAASRTVFKEKQRDEGELKHRGNWSSFSQTTGELYYWDRSRKWSQTCKSNSVFFLEGPITFKLRGRVGGIEFSFFPSAPKWDDFQISQWMEAKRASSLANQQPLVWAVAFGLFFTQPVVFASGLTFCKFCSHVVSFGRLVEGLRSRRRRGHHSIWIEVTNPSLN